MGSLLLASKCNILPGTLVEMEPKVEFAAGRFLLVFYLATGTFSFISISLACLSVNCHSTKAKFIAGRLSQEACQARLEGRLGESR